MSAIALARLLRASPAVNLLVRRSLRASLPWARRLESFAGRWRIRGATKVSLHGTTFLMHGEEDDPLLDALYYEVGWESGETLLFASLARSADLVLDIGANTGIYSLMSTRVSDSLHVIAVEPSPANAERLRRNLKLNGETRVEVVETALGTQEGLLEFTVPADGSISVAASPVDAFSRAHFGIEYTKVLVAQTTLDKLVDDHGLDHVDLIKLDVEHFELEVLKGAAHTLDSFSPVILAEVFDYDILVSLMPELAGRVAADNCEQVGALMAAHGYSFFAVGARGILRVAALGGAVDGGANYLFVKDPPERRFVPYADAHALESLLGDRSDRANALLPPVAQP